jgi:hypothetical protein
MTAEQTARLEYLRDLYGMYVGNLNSMFNFFLVVAALIANAYFAAMNPDLLLPEAVPSGVGLLGALLCGIFSGIDQRSRSLLDSVERELKLEEQAIFPRGRGFFAPHPDHVSDQPSLRVLFPLAYGAFLLSFIGLAVFPFLVG